MNRGLGSYSLQLLVAVKRFQKSEVTPANLRTKVIFLIVKTVQCGVFPVTYARLHSNQPLPESDPLLPLDPSKDQEGIIRLVGRL